MSVAQHAVLFIPVIGILDLANLSCNLFANDFVQKFICEPASRSTLALCLLPAWSTTDTTLSLIHICLPEVRAVVGVQLTGYTPTCHKTT